MTTTSDAAPIGFPETSGDKGLKSGAVGLLSTIVVGVASTAPAYSLAASLGLVVASGGALLAGVKAPAIMLLAFVPMYFIAVAYQELNKAEPDCGTSFTWASRAFGPWVGWMAGWGIIAADVIVMANLAQIAGSYSFSFADTVGLHNTLADSTFWSTVAGVIWIAVMTYICYRGIEISARIQYALLSIEVVVLFLFAAVALIKVYTGHAESYSLHPQWSWLWPGGLSVGNVIAPALLTAVFIYWGWDSAVSINEETDDPATTPGRAAVLSTLILLFTYAIVSVATVAFAGTGTKGVGLGNQDNADDVFSAISPALFGDSTLGHIGQLLLAASILTSASASTQTTILPTARTALSMAVFKAVPQKFSRIHAKYLTPTWSTVGMGIISVVFYLLFTLVSQNLLTALIQSIGLMIAFYYGLTGFSCVWFYRRNLFTSPRNFVMQGLFPLLGGLILLAAFGYAIWKYISPDWLPGVTIFGLGAVAVVGLVALALGIVLMVVWYFINPSFFRQQTLPRKAAHELVLAGIPYDPAGDAEIRLPDAGLPDMLISEDLSNLPPGQRAVRREDLDD